MATAQTENFEAPSEAPAVLEQGRSTARKVGRILALDFTKGALVLTMVLYHWINYFLGPSDNRYLRFLTPSFIFITGFLISNVYLSKYGMSDPQLPKRFLQRGLKILAVFVFLNLARVALFPRTYGQQMLVEHSSVKSLVDIYLVGSNLGGGQGKAIAFFILVPIAFLLLLSALLLWVGKTFQNIFRVGCALSFLLILILHFGGYQSANLELLAIGLLGIVIGYMPIEKINALLVYPYILVFAYLCYLGAITLWNIIYPLQVVGVCLSLLILYLLGGQQAHPNRLRRLGILLGKYSLLGYIAQIAILQMLRQALQRADLNTIATQILSFVAAFALTILVVEATDRARRRIALMDRLYRTVFA